MKEGYILKIKRNELFIDDEPFYLASGDMHYFRHFKGGWKRRLELMKDFGLTAVQTYVPWNLHEPEEGEFCFIDNLDIAYFLQLCQEVGLKVMFRPSPYICSEMDFGGLPYWLLKEDKLSIRCSCPLFMKHIKNYYTRLINEIRPFLSTNGGPIIAVAVENEYGSFCDDNSYLEFLANLLKSLGVDVPLYTANGIEPKKFINGSISGAWNTVDAHNLTSENIQTITSLQPDKPIYLSEFWGGRSQQWGCYFLRQTPDSVAEKYENLLNKNLYVNFYMFCGGTNFGFTNGALVGRSGADAPDAEDRFLPFATSYDVDAPVTEYGYPTEKYFKCKKVLSDYKKKHGIPDTASKKTHKDYEVKTQNINEFSLTKSADLLDNINNISNSTTNSPFPLSFEEINQAFGFVLYSTFINNTDDLGRVIEIEGLRDRAIIFGNKKYLGTLMRDGKNSPVTFKIPENGLKIDILVENLGRVNYGTAMLKNKKGILDYVKIRLLNPDGSIYKWDYSTKSTWTNHSLPLNDLTKLDYSKEYKELRPAFFSGEFKAQPGVDTFLNPEGWTKGVVWINGFNLGRYWEIGPQRTLYVPGELLKENNTITVLELHKPKETYTIKFDKLPSIDTIPKPKHLLEISVVG